jgi:CHAD domain-containing protein
VLHELLVAGKHKRWRSNRVVAIDERRAVALSGCLQVSDSALMEQTLNEALKSAQRHLAALTRPPELSSFAQSRLDVVLRAERKYAARSTRRKRGNYATLHQARIAIKKLRYLLEFFARRSGQDGEVDAARLRMIRELLGELNDLVASDPPIRKHADALGSRRTVRRALRWLRRRREERRAREARKALRGRKWLDGRV